MKTTLFFRLILYTLSFLIFRGIYLIVAFLMGFGSASDHKYEDIALNIILCLFNIYTYRLVQRISVKYNKTEFQWIMALTILIWLILYFYYN